MCIDPARSKTLEDTISKAVVTRSKVCSAMDRMFAALNGVEAAIEPTTRFLQSRIGLILRRTSTKAPCEGRTV
jgi:hypothetical protein